MAFIPVPDVCAITLDGVWLGEDAVNTLYFRKTGGWSGAQMLALATGVRLWWADEMQGLTSLSGSLQGVRYRGLATANEPTDVVTGSGPLQGTKVGDPTPGPTSFAIKFRTGLAGRSFRGRNFMWGIVMGDVSGNVLSGSQAEGYRLAYNALFDIATAHSCTWVVVSRYANKLPRVTGISTPVTSVSYTDLNLDVMRNRAAGRGD
jgi:hypothetical protein